MSILLPESVTQLGRHEDVSEKYTSITTSDIITSLEGRGFKLDGINVARVRKQSNQGFQKHLVTMKYNELTTAEGVPTIIIQNSHNRSSGLKFHTGFIRFACMNGLVFGSGIEEKSIQHSQKWQEKAESFLDGYLEQVAQMNRQHERMKSQYMSASMISELSHRAAAIRYNPVDVLDTNELSLVTRVEDIGSDLYTVFNRIQESLITGSFKRRIQQIDDEGKTSYSPWGKAGKITSTDENLRINRKIRELALEYA